MNINLYSFLTNEQDRENFGELGNFISFARNMTSVSVDELVEAFITYDPAGILKRLEESAYKKEVFLVTPEDSRGWKDPNLAEYIRGAIVSMIETTKEYLSAGSQKRDLNRLLIFLSKLDLRTTEGRPETSMFSTIRHELDHAAFLERPLGMTYFNLLRENAKSMPAHQLRELGKLNILAEAGGYFFDAVPYNGWEDFRKQPQIYKPKIIEYLTDPLQVASFILSDYYIGYPRSHRQRRSITRRIVDAFAMAYIQDSTRLRRAYDEARTSEEFTLIARAEK